MPLFVASLNSGSNGNCYYVGNQHHAVLIDVGISCREVERRMLRIGLDPTKIRAIFISHEHSDHIRGVGVLSRKYNLPVYVTPGTQHCGGMSVPAHLCVAFRPFDPVTICGLTVTAFPKAHDAADPHSFVVEGEGTTIGVFTDIGNPCANLSGHFSRCHAAFLEANYDEEMLDKGRYPYFLKNRIRGGQGHLSNRQALEVFTTHRPQFMSHLFLAHLSRDNNSPQLVADLFRNHANGIEIIVASRDVETPVYSIGGGIPVRALEMVQGVLFD